MLDAAAVVMADRGIADATMSEIAEQADVALGSLYNHFPSKEALAVAVVDAEIAALAAAIDRETEGFRDPARVFAHGTRTVIQHATENSRWRQLLGSPGVIARSFHDGFGPYARRDLQLAIDAGRLPPSDVALTWRLCTWAIIGFSASVCSDEADLDALPDALAAIMRMVGLEDEDTRALLASLDEPEFDT